MKDTYKGESYGKKVGRWTTWLRMFQWMNAAGIDPEKASYLVLAGRNCGDIDVLQSFGIGEDRVTAVENCDQAFESAKERRPHARLILDDVANVLGPSHKYDAVFLDLCCPLHRKVADLALMAAQSLPHRGIFAINLLRGREHGDAHFARFKHPMKEVTTTLYTPGKDDFTDSDPWDRDTVIAHHVMRSNKGVILIPAGEIRYQSSTVDGNGVPMVTYLFVVCKYNRYRYPRSMVQCTHELTRWILSEDLTAHIEIKNNINVLRAMVADFCSIDPRSMAMTPASVPATKAVATRWLRDRGMHLEGHTAVAKFVLSLPWPRPVEQRDHLPSFEEMTARAGVAAANAPEGRMPLWFSSVQGVSE